MDQETGELPARELTETRYPCEQCGAMLTYAIGSGELECRYCGHRSSIVHSDDTIREIDFYKALRELDQAQTQQAEKSYVHCVQCGASFELETHVHAGECPFCGTAVVTGTGHVKAIKPKALLPFAITDKQALVYYRDWIKGLWFAPSALQLAAGDTARLRGVYIPYWTYDSKTVSHYDGMRGDVYYVQRQYTAIVNGRPVSRTRMEPRIRWTPVSGTTRRHFDDVLIGASRTLPRKITDWLEPWDLDNLVPYSEAYISGFSSEIYQVDLDEGFTLAQSVMENIIRNDVRQQIGGDQQRINRLHTSHSDTTFKHILLPLWMASFRFRDRTYRFVVNGRNGRVQGERPYSAVKITLAVICCLLVLGAALFWLNQGGGAGW